MIKECLQEYSVQEIINKVYIFLLLLIYFSNILKYDGNICLSFLLNYCRINGWELMDENFASEIYQLVPMSCFDLNELPQEGILFHL